MCVPGCEQAVREEMDRRGFLASFAAGVAAIGCSTVAVAPAEAETTQFTFSRVVDLTHSLSANFPTFSGQPQLSMKAVATVAANGYQVNEITFNEHTGTHLDTPAHFAATGVTADAIEMKQLVAPLAVVDIRARATGNADTQLTIDDLKAWESKHGKLPQNACVAMLSGWDTHVQGEKFRNADAEGVMHFPGFHVETLKFLLQERSVVGIAVDTLSLDFGRSADFAAHRTWLPAGKWGLECVAGLSEVPAQGATIIVGAPKIVGASGGPSRVIALI